MFNLKAFLLLLESFSFCFKKRIPRLFFEKKRGMKNFNKNFQLFLFT